jgi:hypothetical protein
LSDFVVQKDNELEALIHQRLADAGLTRESDEGLKIEMEETSKMLATFTPEQRLRHRHLSEWGLLPSSAGGGWDLLYVPDDGKDH